MPVRKSKLHSKVQAIKDDKIWHGEHVARVKATRAEEERDDVHVKLMQRYVVNYRQAKPTTCLRYS